LLTEIDFEPLLVAERVRDGLLEEQNLTEPDRSQQGKHLQNAFSTHKEQFRGVERPSKAK
jgi:hypothetical protein